MDRLACVETPELPIQLLLRAARAAAPAASAAPAAPAAVVDKDSAQGIVRFVNEAARARGVLPGQRYTAALGLCPELRARAVPEPELLAALAEIEAVLADFSPAVERAAGAPGVFLLDAGGLERLEPSLAAWAERIVRALASRSLTARVGVGFTRFGARAAARLAAPVVVFADPAAERRRVRATPLARLDVDPSLRDALARLAIHTVGAFADLPARGIRARFGEAAARLHHEANGRAFEPLQPGALPEPIERHEGFDLPVGDVSTLLFFLKQALDDALAVLALRGEGLERCELELRLEQRASEDVPPLRATLRPAAPTLDVGLLVHLATLHFERSPPPSDRGVDAILLRVHGAPQKHRQRALFSDHPRRDLAAGDRALALLKSRFGEEAVLRAVPRDAHLPEATFRLEPFPALAWAQPQPTLERRAVRRLLQTPLPLTPPGRHPHDDGWVIADLRQGTVVKTAGPYAISGGWWAREVQREYFFVHTLRGDVLWVYFDRARRRWFLQGGLE